MIEGAIFGDNAVNGQRHQWIFDMLEVILFFGDTKHKLVSHRIPVGLWYFDGWPNLFTPKHRRKVNLLKFVCTLNSELLESRGLTNPVDKICQFIRLANVWLIKCRSILKDFRALLLYRIFLFDETFLLIFRHDCDKLILHGFSRYVCYWRILIYVLEILFYIRVIWSSK